jgi:hypothetical protein
MRPRWLLLTAILTAPACDDRKTADPGGTQQRNSPPVSKETAADNELAAADAPYVRGSIAFVGPWKEERLSAGFAGQGADGKPHSNMTGTQFSSDSGTWVQSDTFKPQITRLENTSGRHPEYRHTHLPPGDYVVYAKRNHVPAAWHVVGVKAGDQQSVDLTVDPAKTGEVAVTIPDAEAKEPIRWPLLLLPADIHLPGTAWHQAFEAADVQPGQTSVAVAGVPAGRYKVARGKSSAEVEVVAGRKATVTLVRNGPRRE